MISVEHVYKQYQTRGGMRTVLNDINFELKKGEKVGILGRNGAGKSTLIRLMSGVEPPTSGEIKRSMSISWPLAFSGAFQGSLTGMDNLRFVEPVKIGDTIQVELTCKQKTPKPLRDPEQKPHGVVVWDIKVKNQRNELVATYDILTLVERAA
jgi:energy-coupling factor transporter ATP-binding protein EcfA2